MSDLARLRTTACFDVVGAVASTVCAVHIVEATELSRWTCSTPVPARSLSATSSASSGGYAAIPRSARVDGVRRLRSCVLIAS